MTPRELVKKAFQEFINLGFTEFNGGPEAEAERWTEEFFQEPEAPEDRTYANYLFLALANLLEDTFPPQDWYQVEFDDGETFETTDYDEFICHLADYFTTQLVPLPDFEK